jgi:cathepsin L
LGPNQLTDQSTDEIKRFKFGFIAEKPNLHFPASNPSAPKLEAPQSLDWRTKGAVTSVKNQGQCGGCYAFSAAAAMEGAYQIKTGILNDFSEQQIIDCSGSYGNLGCNGGSMVTSFDFLKDYMIDTWAQYPYVGM